MAKRHRCLRTRMTQGVLEEERRPERAHYAVFDPKYIVSAARVVAVGCAHTTISLGEVRCVVVLCFPDIGSAVGVPAFVRSWKHIRLQLTRPPL